MKALQKILLHTDLLLGAAMLVVVSMLILPIPEWLLDVGLVVAMAAAILIILSAINVDNPLKFNTFPSVLLLITLLRLALSIAATKLILGKGEAGAVISTFGSFVLGGDFVVGIVAFLILMIIQFIVITNGATRVSEVVARFTLDAMPGKQMAIDADLSAGLIDEDQARERRKQVKQEADFYGAMDGASKFVKGDAIASLLIIAVNIIGGFVVGFMRSEGDAMAILQTYAILSVGEGLVSQIPALLISTASGLLVTRTGQDRAMGGALFRQFLAQPKVLNSAGIALICFGFIPGFPFFTFALIGATLLVIARLTGRDPESTARLLESDDERKTREDKAAAMAPSTTPAPASPEDVLQILGVDPLEIELGYSLIRLANSHSGGDLTARISNVRVQLANELGFVMPSVRVRDDASLMPNEYVIKVKGEEVARGQAFPGEFLAIGDPNSLPSLAGSPTKEPVFGLDAIWVDEAQAERGRTLGYQVVEPTAMMATHLTQLVRQYAAELLTRKDVQAILDQTKTTHETVVNELIPAVVKVGDVQKVLQHLLREGVPIRDTVTILETMADFGEKVQNAEQLGELVRASIARTLTRQHTDADTGKLACVTLTSEVEAGLGDSLHITAVGSTLALDPDYQRALLESLTSVMQTAKMNGFEPVLLCSSKIRLPLRRLIEGHLADIPVLAYNEVSSKADIEFVGQVEVSGVAGAA